MMISGVAKSIEDHGFVIDIGKKSCRAFLPKNATGKKKTQRQPFLERLNENNNRLTYLRRK